MKEMDVNEIHELFVKSVRDLVRQNYGNTHLARHMELPGDESRILVEAIGRTFALMMRKFEFDRTRDKSERYITVTWNDGSRVHKDDLVPGNCYHVTGDGHVVLVRVLGRLGPEGKTT
jgi:hypothetical protein